MNSKKLKILLIEDNPGDVRLIQIMLADSKDLLFDVEQADTLATGKDHLDKGGIEALLLDLSLPDSQGMETFSKISAYAPKIPIIILTNLDDKMVAINAMRKGAQDYLVKGEVSTKLLSRVIPYAIERKRAKEELNRLNVELIEKNDELKQIMFFASHDMRTPLVNIMGYSDELREIIKEVQLILNEEKIAPSTKNKLEPLFEKEIPEAFNFISVSLSRIDSMLNSLLKVLRVGRTEIKLSVLDMNKLALQLSETFEYQIKKSGAILELDKLPTCLADERQLEQVFSNLLDNALKYLSSERKGLIEITGVKKDGQTVYCIKDNGIGVKEEQQKTIFKTFCRLDPGHRRGDGLGLTIVSKILNRLGGKILLESEPDKGSKFFVSLPSGETGHIKT